MTFLPHINGLRAIAVLAVMLYHFKIPFLASGFVGVDVFFVISGYLMTSILTSRRHVELGFLQALASFYSGRIRRIVPGLVVLCLSTVVIFGLTLLPSEFNKLLRSNTTALLFVSNFFFRNQSSYFDIASESSPLLHTWSLSLEWQFYLAYPVILYLLRDRGFSTKVSIISAVCVGSFVACVFYTTINPSGGFFLPLSRAWEFSIGALVFLYHAVLARHESSFSKTVASTASLLGLAMLAYSLNYLDRSSFPGWQAMIPVVASALIIADRGDTLLNRVLARLPFQILGSISYSLYLWHWPIYVYLVRSVTADDPMTSMQKLLGIIISIGISIFSYRWVETPCRVRGDFWTDRRMFYLFIISCVTSIVFLAVALKTNGMSFRLPDYLVNAEIAMRDQNPRRKECFVEREIEPASLQRPHCIIGSSKNVESSVVLWGDSFANALLPMVERVLSDAGISGIAATVA
ncbi:MAG: acyltransferase family protein, partial [Betaproteobacteria bacterium]